MIYDVVHTTTYEYDAPVTASYAKVHQLPVDVDGQKCIRRAVRTEPESNHYREHVDAYGNRAAVLEIHEPHATLEVHSTSTVDTTERPTALPARADRPWVEFVPATQGPVDVISAEFALDSPLVGRSAVLAEYGRADFTADASLASALLGLNHRIYHDFDFDPAATEVNTPILEVFADRRGVCQDFAHIMIGCLRSIGLGACYVSGYLETLPPPGKPKLTGADRTHAWVGVHLGDGQWIGIDPTNDQLAGPRYITTARGRDYADIAPLKGVIFTEAETSTLTVSVDVTPQSSS